MLSAVAPSAGDPEDWKTLPEREVRVSYELEPVEWSAIPVGLLSQTRNQEVQDTSETKYKGRQHHSRLESAFHQLHSLKDA